MPTTPTAITAQRAEFAAVKRLSKAFHALPPIVDDSYPELHQHYEAAIRDLIDAFKTNGRLQECP